jgi:hypothetical protein
MDYGVYQDTGEMPMSMAGRPGFERPELQWEFMVLDIKCRGLEVGILDSNDFIVKMKYSPFQPMEWLDPLIDSIIRISRIRTQIRSHPVAELIQ